MRWAVVTGGGNGIGAVIAESAAKAGYRVAVWDRDGDAAATVGRSVAAEPGSAVSATVDVTDEAAVERALDELPGAPALLVNNAGIVRFGPLLELSTADWRQVLEVNLTGTFVAGRAAARRMAGSGGGVIVNVSSVNGVAAAPNSGAYSSSKAGVVMLTEQMALEWAARNVRVNAVAPGLIFAGMSDSIYADPQVRTLRQAEVPLGRLGLAEDVAEAALFLASDAAKYITGQTLLVDGGVSVSALRSLVRPRAIDGVGPQP